MGNCYIFLAFPEVSNSFGEVIEKSQRIAAVLFPKLQDEQWLHIPCRPAVPNAYRGAQNHKWLLDPYRLRGSKMSNGYTTCAALGVFNVQHRGSKFEIAPKTSLIPSDSFSH